MDGQEIKWMAKQLETFKMRKIFLQHIFLLPLNPLSTYDKITNDGSLGHVACSEYNYQIVNLENYYFVNL